MKLHIYSPNLSNRLRYTLKVMFRIIVKVDFELHERIDSFLRAEGPKLNYSHENLEGSFQLKPSGFLAETTFKPFEVPIKRVRDDGWIFPRQDGQSGQFETFSAVFYMISRYEEYLPYQADAHGRFREKDSKPGLTQVPAAHHWTISLCEELKASQPFEFQIPAYSFQPTYDIDNAYAHLHKSSLLTMASLVKAALTGGPFRQKIQVLRGKKSDPFDSYSYLKDICQKFQITPVIFMLTASGSKFDRNISPDSQPFEDLVNSLQEFSEVGIHPSYRSSEKKTFPTAERDRLSRILGKPVTKSRQHFLKFSFPETFVRLEANGITDDYSLGYSELEGFRSGMARPYPFFNLLTDEESTLILHPFHFMDSTFQFYSKIPMDEVASKLRWTIDQCRKVGGEFCPLWHNESLGDEGIWKGWRALHDQMFQWAQP